jgi:hypothetical protein
MVQDLLTGELPHGAGVSVGDVGHEHMGGWLQMGGTAGTLVVPQC